MTEQSIHDPLTIHDPLAAALRTWRRQNRIKQSAAGELLGVSQATISRWESGQIDMTSTQRRRVRDLLGRPASRNRALARHLVRTAPGLAGLIDREITCLAVSPAAARQHGSSQDALEGVSFRSRLPPCTESVFERLTRQGFFTGEIASARTVFRVPLLTGGQVLADHLAIPFREGDGSILMLLSSTLLPESEASREGELTVTWLNDL